MMFARVRAFAAERPQLADALLGVLVAAISLVMVMAGPGPHKEGRAPNAGDFLIAVIALILVALRRRWPIPVLVVAVGSVLTMLALDGPTAVLVVATYILLCTVSFRTNRQVGWLAGGIAGVLLYLGGSLFTDAGWADPETLGILAWCGMSVAIGDGVRTRRAYIAAIEERAVRAEQSRDEEARRRVAEERLRIARELHDVVAHNIAMINVQAGVAAHVLRTQPEDAETALAHVRQAARTVLDEIGTLLGVLREPGDPHDDEPTRGLARLSGLLDSLAAAGLTVEHNQRGEARPLPAAVDLAAYRIVQESLTNAQKHGAGAAAHLTLSFSPAGVGIEVWNPVAGEHNGHGTGHGLIGMRERAAAVGGTLREARGDGRFIVQAHLPAEAKS